MNEQNAKKIEALINEEDFLEELKKITSIDDLLKLFADNGVEMTSEEIEMIQKKGEVVMKEKGLVDENGELTEEMLNLVSGGGWGKALLCWAVAAGCVYVGCPQAAVVFVGIGLALL